MNVVITGATKGIGRAIAERFAATAHTVVGCARNEVDLYNMMDNLLTRHPDCNVKVKQVDMSKAAEVKAQHPGLPFQVLRNLLTNRAHGCQCQAVRNILEQG